MVIKSSGDVQEVRLAHILNGGVGVDYHLDGIQGVEIVINTLEISCDSPLLELNVRTKLRPDMARDLFYRAKGFANLDRGEPSFLQIGVHPRAILGKNFGTYIKHAGE